MSEEKKEKVNEAGKAMVEEAYSKAAEEIYANADKKGNKKVFIIAGIVLVVLAAVCIAVLVFNHKHYQSLTQGVLLYQDGSEMRSVTMLDDPVYSTDGKAWNFNEENADNDGNPSATTTDGKYLYFSSNVSGDTFHLYCAKIGNDETTLIAEGVSDYEIGKKGEVFYTADNGFYRYTVKDEAVEHICNNAKMFRLNDKKTEVLILGADNKLSTFTLGKLDSLTAVEENVLSVEDASDDFETIVYKKADGLYMLSKGENAICIASAYGEYHIYNINGKCEVYYTTAERELYYFKEGSKESEPVIANVCKLLGTENEAGMCFAAVGENPEQSSYVLIEGGKAVEMKDMPAIQVVGSVFYNTSEKKVYFVGYENNGTPSGTLYSMGYQMLEKGKVEVVANSVIGIECIAGNKLYTSVYTGNGSVDLYCNNLFVASGIQQGSVKETADKKAVVFRYQVTDADGNGKLALHDGNHVKEVGSCVNEPVCAVSAKEIYLLQNGETEGYTLLKYNGRKLKTIVENIDRYQFLFY